MPPATEHDVAAELEELSRQLEACGRCRLGETRTRLVFGEGDPYADLMFVGEAPGYHEDKQGRPFVGAAGKLLDDLLASIGLGREQVYITNVLKSRPPNNRDPQPDEVEACKPFLFTQIGLIQPRVICSLGNFATKLLSGSPMGITRVHGQPQVQRGRRSPLLPLPDLPSGGGAVHAVHAGHAAGRLPPPARPAARRGAGGRRDARLPPQPAVRGCAGGVRPAGAAEEQASLPLDAPAPDDPPSGESQGSPDPGEQLGLF